MTIISQLEALSSRHPRIPFSPNLPSWVNRFASPQPGQPPVIEARTIKWKLCLTWGTGVKNPFYLDHFGHHWYAVEFSDQEELEYVLDNRPWYVRG
ncbi:hypothetical protein ACFX11_041261 [Malus domestica]